MADAITIPKFIEATDDLFIYSQSNGVAQPGATTQAQMQEFIRNNSDVLKCLVSFLWQPQTQYVVNDVIKSPNMPAGLVAKVTKAGTTSSSEPSWSSTIGTTINDGSVIYTMLQEVNGIATSEQLEAGIDNSVIVTPAGLTAARPIKMYTTWAQLGLDASVNTVEDACAAMPNNSMFCIYIGGTQYESVGVPINGVLQIYKTLTETTLYFMRGYTGGSSNLWVNYYNSAGLRNWTQIALKDEIVTIPPGTILAFAGNTIPNGYLDCNGANISRTTYSTLFAAIGTTYGSGDGSTTFALPNLTDKFLQGGNAAGTTKAAGLPNIAGYFSMRKTALNSTISYAGGAFAKGEDISAENASYLQTSNSVANAVERVDFNAANSNSIYGASTTVQPPAVTVKFIIKY